MASDDWSSIDEGVSSSIVGEHVGVIGLDRPETRNALTHGMYAALEHLVRTAPSAGIRCRSSPVPIRRSAAVTTCAG